VVRIRLGVGLYGPDGQRLCFCLFEIADGELQVQLFGCRPTGPAGCSVGLDPLRGDEDPCALERHEVL
jgi:hypothetical protein